MRRPEQQMQETKTQPNRIPTFSIKLNTHSTLSQVAGSRVHCTYDDSKKRLRQRDKLPREPDPKTNR